MSVSVKSVPRRSAAYKAGVRAGDVIKTVNGNVVCDVLDYRFYADGGVCTFEITRGEDSISIDVNCKTDPGIVFDTYLMDKQRSCANKCVFCFIDQMPRGMRDSLYFKDDDSRLSFLFGNYITLTNLSAHEVDRIIKMHISPINISVHTTNPQLRVEMMKNKNAGKALEIMQKFDAAGIKMNGQIVCCPGINDGKELVRSLTDLSALKNMECVSIVPVGLTKHRQGLCNLKCHTKESAQETIKIIESFYDGKKRRFYASDEFYLLAGLDIPPADFYGDFLQLENGVGMCALTQHEANQAFEKIEKPKGKRNVGVITGVAAAPLMNNIVDTAKEKWHNFNGEVLTVVNDYFGHSITVAGLLTATDIINQLKGKNLPEELLIPACMLRQENGVFLDDYTVKDVKKALNVKKITVVPQSGQGLVCALAGIRKLKKEEF